jgi:MFS family permease
VAAMYWRHSGRHPEPVLNRRHFAGWPFGALNLVPLAFFAGTLSLDGFLPIFVQGALGRSNTVAAFAVAALAIGWTSGSQLSSFLVRRIANVDMMVFGFVLVLPALGVGAFVYTASVALPVVLLLSFLQGLGVGSITNVTVSLLQQAADSSEMGRVSAAHQFSRHVGITLGAALSGAILFGSFASRIGTVEPLRRLLENEEIELVGDAREAVAHGFRLATIAAILITLFGLAVALRIRSRFRAER